MGDGLDVLARAHQQRAPLIPRLSQQPPGGAQVELPEGRDVDGAEEQRPVEDVVAGEVLAVSQREHQRDHRRL